MDRDMSVYSSTAAYLRVAASALFGGVAGAGLFISTTTMIERLAVRDHAPPRDPDVVPGEDTNLDDEEVPLVGRAFPVSLALLALAFMSSAVLVAGLPPLSSFIAKVSLLRALASSPGKDASSMIFAALLLSGLAATFSLARAGIRALGGPLDRRNWVSDCSSGRRR